jgi:hypothetical protein
LMMAPIPGVPSGPNRVMAGQPRRGHWKFCEVRELGDAAFHEQIASAPVPSWPAKNDRLQPPCRFRRLETIRR